MAYRPPIVGGNPVGGAGGGITAASPQVVEEAALAVLVGMDWRPFLGVRPEDAGTPIERALARVVLERVVDARITANKL